jgi:CRISPR system Cascade subunit CasD
MPEHLLLRLEGPLQAWGDVALDPRRPTLPFPSRSALAGLLANALGWRYRDAEQITALQDALRYAVREDRQPQMLVDYQTADLDDPRKDPGWTSWGKEDRGSGTQILWKHYLADGCFRVTLTLTGASPITLPELSELATALRQPARPLFLGRKSCPPACPLLEQEGVQASDPYEALRQIPALDHHLRRGSEYLRCWYEASGDPAGPTIEVWDRRDFRSNRFVGTRRVVQGSIAVADLPSEMPL